MALIVEFSRKISQKICLSCRICSFHSTSILFLSLRQPFGEWLSDQIIPRKERGRGLNWRGEEAKNRQGFIWSVTIRSIFMPDIALRTRLCQTPKSIWFLLLRWLFPLRGKQQQKKSWQNTNKWQGNDLIEIKGFPPSMSLPTIYSPLNQLFAFKFRRRRTNASSFIRLSWIKFELDHWLSIVGICHRKSLMFFQQIMIIDRRHSTPHWRLDGSLNMSRDCLLLLNRSNFTNEINNTNWHRKRRPMMRLIALIEWETMLERFWG